MKIFCIPSITAPLLLSALLLLVGAQSPYLVFNQTLDHGSENSETFPQLYSLNTTFFKPGGPILFDQGAETAILPSSYSLFSDWAEELGAMVVSLEHRFFGQSFPRGVGETNATAKDFATLTLDNVLLDSVTFIESIKKTVPGATDSKVIVQGGSYGGYLTTQLRLRYPETFYATFSTCAPMRSFGKTEENPYKFDWWNQISNAYRDTSAAGSAKIKPAMQELQHCAENGCPDLISAMNFCDSGPADAAEWAALLEAWWFTYQQATQFNYGFANPALGFPAFALPKFLDQILLANSTAAVLRVSAWLKIQLKPDECLNWQNMTTGLGDTIGGSFEWITCKYFTVSQEAIPEDSVFPSRATTGPVLTCNTPEWLSPLSFKTNEEIMNEVGLNRDNVEKVGRIINIQGSYDPVAGVGNVELKLSSDRNASRTILVSGLAHTEDFFSESLIPRGVKPTLDEIRDTKKQYIKEWLGVY